jgi:hypothetical protein
VKGETYDAVVFHTKHRVYACGCPQSAGTWKAVLTHSMLHCETKRIAYVACSRAAQSLLILTPAESLAAWQALAQTPEDASDAVSGCSTLGASGPALDNEQMRRISVPDFSVARGSGRSQSRRPAATLNRLAPRLALHPADVDIAEAILTAAESAQGHPSHRASRCAFRRETQ